MLYALLCFGRPEAHCRSTVGCGLNHSPSFGDQPVDRFTFFGRPFEPSFALVVYERVGAWISFIAYDPMI